MRDRDTTIVRDADIHVRVGLHTGECDVFDGDVSGIAVHAAGSGLVYEDVGEHELKGLTGPWRLFSVRA